MSNFAINALMRKLAGIMNYEISPKVGMTDFGEVTTINGTIQSTRLNIRALANLNVLPAVSHPQVFVKRAKTLVVGLTVQRKFLTENINSV